jgi:8-oxo-dGTP diphosphatase
MNMPVIDVAVCIVGTADGRVLLAERTPRQVSAGFWELPGGKVEAGETPAAAAARELLEETGLTPVGLTPWMTYEHQFPAKRLRLHFFRARLWEGTPHGREGQRLAWVDPRTPHVGPILPSNDRALFALARPPVYVVVDFGAHAGPDDFLARLRMELSDGARLIRVRMSPAPPGQRTSLMARVATLACAVPGAAILTASIMDARQAGLAGVHSCTSDLRRLTARPPVRIWAATCHHYADLARAVSLGADFVVLSPILPDPDRPHQAPIGWHGLARCVAAFPVSIYAHGGLGLDHAASARQAGAAGVAVNGAVATHRAAPRASGKPAGAMQRDARVSVSELLGAR